MGDATSKAVELAQEDGAFLSDSPRSNSSADSRPLRSPGNGTLLIFDWDDTLLSSTAVAAGNATAEQLLQLQQTVVSLLRLSMSLGETMIVTNGNATWVRDSSQRFLPGVAPTLADIEVVSARALYENMYPGDPFAWKREAFYRLLERRLAQGGPGAKTTNLVVLGDSPAEMEAAHQATKVLGSSVLVKTVKFREVPTIQQLMGQLNRVRQDLRDIVDTGRPLSKRLEQRRLTPTLTPMTSWGSAWRLVATADWGRPVPLMARDLVVKDEGVPAGEMSAWVLLLGDKIASMTKSMVLKS
uniref:Uncharacterized protein n=1 Tax=Alexandrium monilatum TaxID=311494 RepID=A0A7S4SGX1_9DINO